ncbi:MAG TPA: YdeI/OmpD-associated family protein [Flavobacteriales bacterium]|nr:YdeI/OmpD-associated family protein [Flavobacteriales bacterium]
MKRPAKEKPIINNSYTLEKFHGKGGWTYALLSDVKKINGKFPKLKVKGTIDGYPIKEYTLMPYGHEGLFLPVKAEIRRQIGKKEGDRVKVVLYRDEAPFNVPGEFLLCLTEEPAALRFFESLSESEQRLYVLWIFSARRVETKADRIAKSIEKLLKKQKLYQKQE